jgi:hypothetical protein
MGGRYYLTGVQLGILMANTDEKTRMKILQDIMDNQYLGDKEDLEAKRKYWEMKYKKLEEKQ